VQCPICNVLVVELDINRHLDSNCSLGRVSSESNSLAVGASSSSKNTSSSKKTEDLKSIAPIFNHAKKRPTIEATSSQSSDSRHDDDLTTPTKLLSNERPPKRQKTNIIDTSATTPLAERLRPKEFSEFVGQDHLIGPDSLLVHLLQGKNGSAGSMIFWGPSGCGKTTLARLLARRTDATFKEVSATSSGTTDVRKMMEDAKKLLSLTGR
jgi:putative ATPase